MGPALDDDDSKSDSYQMPVRWLAWSENQQPLGTVLHSSYKTRA